MFERVDLVLALSDFSFGMPRASIPRPASLEAQVGRPDGRVERTPPRGNGLAEERPGSVEQGGG